MPDWLKPTWPARRLVLDQLATWTEVSTLMSIDDVDEMCIAAELYNEAVNRKD